MTQYTRSKFVTHDVTKTDGLAMCMYACLWRKTFGRQHPFCDLDIQCSTDHCSASVAKVLNLCTSYVSPQFHLVFDDKFTSVNNPESAELVDPARFDADHWERIIESGHELYLDPNEPYIPGLDDTWRGAWGLKHRQDNPDMGSDKRLHSYA